MLVNLSFLCIFFFQLFARAVRVVTGFPCLAVYEIKIYATEGFMPSSAETPAENVGKNFNNYVLVFLCEQYSQ